MSGALLFYVLLSNRLMEAGESSIQRVFVLAKVKGKRPFSNWAI
jgi:hypothetical protein